ncbi:mannitol-1-phosphate 5-dehydrogenase [Bacillus sp. ISL-47]|uniref:mannitol-1-phosphate 5-dehydrogenase n=1 Tax=Bacillus sp. ISL-47 TaxID=2819130 RepID=UPI001BEC1ECA|nr:mannitol-1-phosphate 5-dehydrogenase [Bacillus sp. ISL-47]MBT2687672.1 mannitol-1-phosphate 5-dehydrogenase [Bacillus sp. ISL-47]MBT2707453.1 mannitol-1-phosphate 5-dehydrogenase [Pseudomonas sp. ISL-84]
MRQAVHFGAGNIGRGFIGALFSQSGYNVVFVDIADQVINQLNEEKQYKVKLAADEQETMTIENVSGLNNLKQEKEVIEAIKNAAFLTTAIGPNILPRIAPLIAKGLAARIEEDKGEKLYVIACENQISATDLLKGYIMEHLDSETKEKVQHQVSFLNSAVDRIVPIQNNQGSLDVLVEPYHEWVVETTEEIPPIEGMKIVPELAPFIERKLFTVNTGHAVIAYLGYLENKKTIDQTLADEEIRNQVQATLGETGAYLIKRYDLDPEAHQKYIDKIMCRFQNAHLNDGVTRVGRSPLRKLGPDDRLIRPAVQAQKAGLSSANLAKAIAAALMFDYEGDEEAVKLQDMIEENGVAYVLQEVCRLDKSSYLANEIISQYQSLKK